MPPTTCSTETVPARTVGPTIPSAPRTDRASTSAGAPGLALFGRVARVSRFCLVPTQLFETQVSVVDHPNSPLSITAGTMGLTFCKQQSFLLPIRAFSLPAD